MNRPQSGEVYRHFKGNIITIIDIARHTETLEEMVVYRHDGDVWVRPLAMFLEKVDREKYPNVKQTYRFELVENSENNEE